MRSSRDRDRTRARATRGHVTEVIVNGDMGKAENSSLNSATPIRGQSALSSDKHRGPCFPEISPRCSHTRTHTRARARARGWSQNNRSAACEKLDTPEDKRPDNGMRFTLQPVLSYASLPHCCRFIILKVLLGAARISSRGIENRAEKRRKPASAGCARGDPPSLDGETQRRSD